MLEVDEAFNSSNESSDDEMMAGKGKVGVKTFQDEFYKTSNNTVMFGENDEYGA